MVLRIDQIITLVAHLEVYVDAKIKNSGHVPQKPVNIARTALVDYVEFLVGERPIYRNGEEIE